VKVGDNVVISTQEGIQTMLVVREVTFKEYCNKHDDLMLEYDIDDAWKAWREKGPVFEVLRADGTLGMIWPE
jgi:hypothetical protein